MECIPQFRELGDPACQDPGNRNAERLRLTDPQAKRQFVQFVDADDIQPRHRQYVEDDRTGPAAALDFRCRIGSPPA